MNSLMDFYKGKRVLVTGHTGFKGAWMSRLLIMAGAEVTGYALDPPTDPNLFEILGLKEQMDSVIGDIRDLDSLRKTFERCRPEIVIHMAAQPIVRTSYKEPVLTFETNVMGTVNVLECARQCPSVRSLVNVTTDKVYLNEDNRTESFREDEPLMGWDPYSNSKSCSELVTYSYRNSFAMKGISTVRAGNVIGGGDFAVDRIIPDCYRAMEAGEAIRVRNPESIRPFQHVLEPVYVYLYVAMKQYEDESFAGNYNVGPDEKDCINAEQLVKTFCEAWGEEAHYEVRPDGGPKEANFLKLNCDKLKKTFGLKPKSDIKDAVSWSVEWYREYLNHADVAGCTDRQIKRFLDK